MRKTLLINFLFLFAACNQQQPANGAAKTPDSIGSHKIVTDPLFQEQEKTAAAKGIDSIKLSVDSAENIVWAIMNKDTFLTGETGTKEGTTKIYNKNCNIKKVFTLNGYLIKAQRHNAVYDKYINIYRAIDDIDPFGKSIGFMFVSSDSIKKQFARVDTELNEITEYLKNSHSVIEVLDYDDLRYGQMCSMIAPYRAVYITAYLITQGIDPSRFVAVGFGYDEPYVMRHDTDIFKRGDTLNDEYISKLSEKDQKKAYGILEGVEVEVIVLAK